MGRARRRGPSGGCRTERGPAAPHAGRLASWVRSNSKGEIVPAPPPVAVVKSVLATPDPGLPVLMGIVNTPVFGRNGKLLTSPGYHPDARLLYHPAPGFAVPAIPERPTAAQIAEARTSSAMISSATFPFVSPSEMAHAVALLLLGFVRSMIDGPTPLHLIEKPTPGTGATLMVDSIATILTGAGASVMTEGRDDEEWRKRVTAKLRQMPSIVLIDNLRNKLDSSAVAAALTAPFWEDRILGASEMAQASHPLRVDRHRQQSGILQRDGPPPRAHPARCPCRAALAARQLPASRSHDLGTRQPGAARRGVPDPLPGVDRRRTSTRHAGPSAPTRTGQASSAAFSRPPASRASSATSMR